MVSANPTGPITVASARNGAYGDSVARLLELAGHEVEREYYYNDAGAQMDRFRASVEAVRRGEEPPEDGYHGDVHRASSRGAAIPVAAMRKKIEDVARALPHPHRLVGEPERDREARARAAAEARHLRGGRDVLGAHDRVRRRQGPAARPLVRRLVPLLRGRRRLRARTSSSAASTRAIYVLGADHHGYVALAKAAARDARLRPRARRGAALPARPPHAGRRADEDVEAARRRRLPRRASSTRSASTPRAGTSSTAAPTRRSRSTSTSPRSGRRRTRSTTSSTRTRASPASSATLRTTPSIVVEPAGQLAPEESELIKRLAELPSVVADAAAKRGPQAIPTYAIRVADDFHRFYHEHRVLESEQQAFRLALCRATQIVIARCLDLVGVEAPERM